MVAGEIFLTAGVLIIVILVVQALIEIQLAKLSAASSLVHSRDKKHKLNDFEQIKKKIYFFIFACLQVVLTCLIMVFFRIKYSIDREDIYEKLHVPPQDSYEFFGGFGINFNFDFI